MAAEKRRNRGGITIPDQKGTMDFETVKMGIPEKVIIPMLQHIGAPCKHVVEKGEAVKVGQVIGESTCNTSSPIHSSVSGTVTGVLSVVNFNGSNVEVVEIKTDGLQEMHESVAPPRISNRKEFLEAIKESGLVGLGGAGFPTHTKLNTPKDKEIDILLINGSECEPYITSDYREMMENSDNLINGINLVLDKLEIPKAIIAIEKNKPEAIKKLTELTEYSDRIKVQILGARYPEGAEKTLIYELTGRRMLIGQLPMDVGVVMLNVSTAAFISEYVKTGIPIIKKRVTVDGSAVREPKNVEVLIGTPMADVFEFCGGFVSEPYKILMGGPMMGIAQFSLDSPVLKQNNAILAFNKKDAILDEETACIKCARCAGACPVSLMPMQLNLLVRNNRIDELEKYYIHDCYECGCCSYVCPAKIHLVQSIRLGKEKLRNSRNGSNNRGNR